MDEQKIEYHGSMLFLSGATLGYIDDLQAFLLLAKSGSEAHGYAITPEHAKRIMFAFQKQIEKYEKKFGIIDTRLPEDGVKSPFEYPKSDQSPSVNK